MPDRRRSELWRSKATGASALRVCRCCAAPEGCCRGLCGRSGRLPPRAVCLLRVGISGGGRGVARGLFVNRSGLLSAECSAAVSFCWFCNAPVFGWFFRAAGAIEPTHPLGAGVATAVCGGVAPAPGAGAVGCPRNATRQKHSPPAHTHPLILSTGGGVDCEMCFWFLWV